MKKIYVGLLILLFGSSLVYSQNLFEELQGEMAWLSAEISDYIFTASNQKERMDESPAITIVLTEQDIKEKGYTDLNLILDDLSGFHTSRSYGDTYFRNVP